MEVDDDAPSSAMALMESKADTVVLPGDLIGEVEEGVKLVIGPGLRQEDRLIFAAKAGILRRRDPNRYFVDSNQKRYVPAVGDLVVGTVIDKSTDLFKVDVGAALPVTVSSLAFEGATKRNRPTIGEGALLYCRLSLANKDMEPEAVCTNAAGKSAGFGELKGGFAFTVSLGLARQLMGARCVVLEQLGRRCVFESAIGMNGRVWVRCEDVRTTVVVVNAIRNSEHMTSAEVAGMMPRLEQELRSISFKA